MSKLENIIEVDNLHFGYNGGEILRGINLALKEGEMVGVIGPNGSGKSTLLKLVSGLFSPWKGEVRIKGKPVASYKRREIARIIASVSQDIERDFPFTVREIVSMGRSPYLGRFAIEGKGDRKVIDGALELTDIAHYGERFPYQLSGGERQRMLIARALAQEPQVLLMDEPTSYLDLNHQIEINRLVLQLKNEKSLGVIYVTHDLNIAAECCDRVVMLKKGEIIAEGKPMEVISRENIETVYGCHVLVDENPETGRPRVTPVMSEGVHG
ncbi:MAG: ABC transporter ATP-binding protein [Deltaproteobacteria bacterium]|nr:ABC transporter ATP-binding protein [Deltaproteobacteria bacterium]